MTKEELFKKYNIDESHSEWDDVMDSWYSVEIYKLLYKKLPTTTNLKICWVISFLDKKEDMNWWLRNVMLKSDWGSYYLTAKRMVYRYADYIIDEINNS